MSTELPIGDISDTALLAAIYRAYETERADALFRDPFARRLAGDRAEQIATAIPFSNRNAWAWVVRTYLFDQFISEQCQRGVDLVVNLAAGLDTRPYRMPLPRSLNWVEIDLRSILDYKASLLAGESPICTLTRVAVDILDRTARRQVFESISTHSTKALVVAEGILIYFAAEEVAALAEDLASAKAFGNLVIDLVSPGLLRVLQKNMNPALARAGSLKFGPQEGPAFFLPHGWRAVDVRSPIKTAARFKRLSLGLRLLSLLPQLNAPQGSRPWSGVCLLERVG